MQPHCPDVIDSHVSVGVEHHLKLDVDDYRRRMGDSHVRTAILRPMGAELAVFNRAGNDRTLNAGAGFKTLATANPWFGDDALQELRRCKTAGAVGLYLHPTRQGFMPTDPVVEPLLQLAADFRWPVVIHTGTYILSDVLAVAELALRYPSLTFVCDCAGFADMWFELPQEMAEHANLLLCASLIWPRAIGNTVKNIGAERVLFGSGEPRDSLPAAFRRIDRLELSDTDCRAVLFDNAMRVFGLS